MGLKPATNPDVEAATIELSIDGRTVDGKGRRLALRCDRQHRQDHSRHVLPLYVRSVRILRHVPGHAGREKGPGPLLYRQGDGRHGGPNGRRRSLCGAERKRLKSISPSILWIVPFAMQTDIASCRTWLFSMA